MNSTLICDPMICESSSWVLGAAGTCNNSTGVCECPPGYSGTYILVSENDCHISTVFRQFMGVANFCVAVLALIASIIGLVKVTKDISRIYRPRIFPYMNKAEYSIRVSKRRLRNKTVFERKLVALSAISLFFIQAVCEVVRTSALLRDHEAYAHGLPVDAAIIAGFGFGASRWAFFLSLYIHTSSLPKNEQLAVVLGRQYDAKRYAKST